MVLTIKQHIFCELQASEPMTEKELQFALSRQSVTISLKDLDLQLTELIQAGWVEYYGITRDPELAYQLSNHWDNLVESEREKLLVG